MAEPNHQPEKPKTNFELIFKHLKTGWKADYLKIVLGKYPILFYAFIFILLWQFFHNVFDGIIEKVYKYSAAHIPLNTITSWLFVFIAVFTIIVYYHKISKIQYRPNLNFSFFILFIGVVYFSSRWSHKWEFYVLWRSPIALADIYVLFLIGEIWSWVKFLSKSLPEKKLNSKYFELDDPDDNEDEFGRKEFAKDITEYICNSFGSRSLAVGISGSWGTGKSYLLHQIQNTIIDKNDSSIVVIKFNPWRSSTHNRIVEDFLQTIKTALCVYDKSLSNKFEKYLKVLIETDKTNWIKTIFDTLSIPENKSSEQLYNEINGCLQLIHKKLVIFIDDLDRLHNEEIIEVFRIVRNTADFYNTCFVVAYDREYVEKTFPTTNLQMNNYLDKIFQTEFVLPTVDPNILINIILAEVLKRFENNRLLEHELKQLFTVNDRRYLILNNILHKRDAIRFANMYSFDLKSIQDEVDYGDFFLVELLKMKYPSVFNILQFRDNRHVILELNRKKNRNVYKLLPEGFDNLKEKNKKIFDLLNQNTNDNIHNLLKELFNEMERVPLNSIRYVDNYYKYFNLIVSQNDIKRKEFLKVLDYSFQDAKPIIDNWFKEKNKGSLDILFNNYGLSDFEHFGQIQNYIYGIKKVSIGIELRNAVTNFHVALNNAGFYRESLSKFLKSNSREQLDELIIQLLFPEGIMDAYNGIFIEQLYTEGEEGNNLYSKEKSKELIISRFKQLQNDNALNLLFDDWKTIVSGKDFDKWDEDIFKLTNDFADQIIENMEFFKPLIAARVENEKTLEKSGQNKAVIKGDAYRKEYNILKDVGEILANNFLHLPGENKNDLQKEKKIRISFYRELIKNLDLPAYHLSNFIILCGPHLESYKDYNIYEGELLDIYPINKNEFEKIDNELFQGLSAEFDFRVDLRNKGKLKINYAAESKLTIKKSNEKGES